MYILCKVCGNDTFRITVEFVIECARCGAKKNLRLPESIPKPNDVRPFKF